MLLLTHILIALSSVVYTTITFIRPTKTKLTVSYGFAAATLASGTYLVIATHSNLVSSCLSGLTYLAIVGAGIAAASYRLKHAYQR